MKCIICYSKMHEFFPKQFHEYGLQKVEYFKCEHCGFVISKTHKDLSSREWEKLNREFHESYQSTDSPPGDAQWVERLNEQATVINDITKLGLLPRNMSTMSL